MNYAEFQKQVRLSKQDICREIYADNRNSIRIKKENTVVKNLERIFSATLKIGNKKGFQAMSMRDLGGSPARRSSRGLASVRQAVSGLPLILVGQALPAIWPAPAMQSSRPHRPGGVWLQPTNM